MSIKITKEIKNLKSWNRLRTKRGLVIYLKKGERKAEVAWQIMMSLT